MKGTKFQVESEDDELSLLSPPKVHMLIIVFDLTYHTNDPYDTLPCVIPFFNVLACFLGKVIRFNDSVCGRV